MKYHTFLCMYDYISMYDIFWSGYREKKKPWGVQYVFNYYDFQSNSHKEKCNIFLALAMVSKGTSQIFSCFYWSGLIFSSSIDKEMRLGF